jgi:hypothetical protein
MTAGLLPSSPPREERRGPGRLDNARRAHGTSGACLRARGRLVLGRDGASVVPQARQLAQRTLRLHGLISRGVRRLVLPRPEGSTTRNTTGGDAGIVRVEGRTIMSLLMDVHPISPHLKQGGVSGRPRRSTSLPHWPTGWRGRGERHRGSGCTTEVGQAVRRTERERVRRSRPCRANDGRRLRGAAAGDAPLWCGRRRTVDDGGPSGVPETTERRRRTVGTARRRVCPRGPRERRCRVIRHVAPWLGVCCECGRAAGWRATRTPGVDGVGDGRVSNRRGLRCCRQARGRPRARAPTSHPRVRREPQTPGNGDLRVSVAPVQGSPGEPRAGRVGNGASPQRTLRRNKASRSSPAYARRVTAGRHASTVTCDAAGEEGNALEGMASRHLSRLARRARPTR